MNPASRRSVWTEHVTAVTVTNNEVNLARISDQRLFCNVPSRASKTYRRRCRSIPRLKLWKLNVNCTYLKQTFRLKKPRKQGATYPCSVGRFCWRTQLHHGASHQRSKARNSTDVFLPQKTTNHRFTYRILFNQFTKLILSTNNIH